MKIFSNDAAPVPIRATVILYGEARRAKWNRPLEHIYRHARRCHNKRRYWGQYYEAWVY